jgi:hypothetical protein
MEQPTPLHINEGIEFDSSVYDEIEKIKGYKEYIQKNKVPQLITFGEEYVND